MTISRATKRPSAIAARVTARSFARSHMRKSRIDESPPFDRRELLALPAVFVDDFALGTRDLSSKTSVMTRACAGTRASPMRDRSFRSIDPDVSRYRVRDGHQEGEG